MTTSGTVATTTILTSSLIEHAYRRIGKPASAQTPEGVQICLESLYLLLLGLSSRGLNLWCIETDYVSLITNQATYAMPAGTIDVLNVVYSQPTQTTGTDTTTSTTTKTTLTSSTSIYRIGLVFSTISASDTVVIASSTDDITYTTRSSTTKTDWATSTTYWINLDPFATATYWRVSTTSTSAASTFYLASSIYDLPVTIWNRDTYFAMNNKGQSGRPSTNYYYEKLLTPQVTLWPVPTNSTDHLTIVRHRQIEDIGTLTQTLDLPQRWLEAIIWQLAERLCFELDGIDPTRMAMVLDRAAQNLITAEGDETDGAPIYFTPSISCYTS